MELNAVITIDHGTLVTSLPVSSLKLLNRLQSIGITQGPDKIKISDDEDAAIRVKLYGEDELGKHLVRIVSENDDLASVNLMAYMVMSAKPEIRNDLARGILQDEYDSVKAVMDSVRQLLHDSGPIREIYYFPIVGNLDHGNGDIFTVSNSFLMDYDYAIRDLLIEEQRKDIAACFDRDSSLKKKLSSARWDVEEIAGVLYGRVECRFKEEPTDSELAVLREWITSQNSHGFGAQIEQKAIESEDGDMWISLWHNGNDYALMTLDELEERLQENNDMTMGGM